MMRPLFFSIVIAAAALQLSACDDGTKNESQTARSRDSSLASDLRMANGDSGALADTPASVATDASSSARVVSDGSLTVSESPGAVAGASGAAVKVSAEDYAGPSCASPAPADQRRCLMAYLARSDVALDRNYQALITALKRESGPLPAAREPATVVRLRTAQRNWLVYRDDECLRRNAGIEGPLWAPTRAKCLSEYSERRTKELANALSSRAAVKPVTKATPTRRAKVAKRVKHRRR
ncbi:MAG: lysozyme inhibitor LprI family protein [bacterium]